MSKIVSICHINGNVFQKIKYDNFDELSDKLKLFIIYHDSDILIQLIINNNILNNFNIIDNVILSNLNDDIITVIFSQKKKELYFR